MKITFLHNCVRIDHDKQFLSVKYRNKVTLLFITYYIVIFLTLKVLVATIDAQWEGIGDVGSARNEPALLPPCPTIRVLSYSN